MRVLHLIETLGRGGAENVLVSLLPALKTQGIEPVVGVFKPPYDLEEALVEKGIKVVRLERFAKWNLAKGARIVRDLAQKEQAEVIHSHLYFPGLYCAMANRAYGLPAAETFHNLAYAGANRGGLKLASRRHIRSLLARSADVRYFGVSAAVARHYKEALGLANVDVMFNPVDLDLIERVTSPRPAVASSRLQIMVPGRLVHEKGHEDLLHALSASDIGEFDLTFLGDGPHRSAIEALARQLAIPVTISGVLAHAQLLGKLAGADIVITPSRFEGFGLATAEAMALGKPVISSDAGGLPEVVGDAGLLFGAGDIDGLTAAIAKLAGDSQMRAELSARGPAHIAKNFSARAVASQMASAYRQLLDSKR